MSEYANPPSGASLKLDKFEAKVSDTELNDFKQLLRLSRIGPQTFENMQEDALMKYGISRNWLEKAKKHWESAYDWRKTEKKINSYPNFTTKIKDDDGEEYDIHFVALFSERSNATPLLWMHGWPGSFLEFLPMLSLLKKRYSPKDLPYHVIVPSLPGYGYSSGPSLKHDFTTEDACKLLNKLMTGLDLNGYIAQGGDIGSFCGRILAAEYQACKALHLNFSIMKKPEGLDESKVDEAENKMMWRFQEFGTTGNAYSLEHGTRPATIGLVLSSSPVAQLAWIGEKFLVWTEHDPPLDDILDSITLYWFTNSFPRAIYPYREFFNTMFHDNPKYFVKKPFAYSWFPYELAPIPKAWVEKTGKVSWHRQHDKGGHFAAMEVPEALLKDVEDFAAQVNGDARL